MLTESEKIEFLAEIDELLEEGESGLLAVTRGEEFKLHYDTIFRAFHNIKGAAAMADLLALRDHMHGLENLLTQRKNDTTLTKKCIDLLLSGIDGARKILAGQTISFSFILSEEVSPEPKARDNAPLKIAVSVPIKEGVTRLNTPPLPSSAKGNADLKPGRVLVVTDSKVAVKQISTLLEEIGIEVKGCADPADALALLPDFLPDIVVTDTAMPQMSGSEVNRAIHQFDPDMPVIYVCGDRSKQSLVEAMEEGVFGALQKPFTDADVIQLCLAGIRSRRVSKLLRKTLELFMFQHAQLDDYLKERGKEEIRTAIRGDINGIIEQRRDIYRLKKTG